MLANAEVTFEPEPSWLLPTTTYDLLKEIARVVHIRISIVIIVDYRFTALPSLFLNPSSRDESHMSLPSTAVADK
jgi:hypothetical protein